MAKSKGDYQWVEVESYKADRTSGLHGEIHVRPVEGQGFPTDMRVECPKQMKTNYPVGSRFRIQAMVKDYETGAACLYTSWRWAYDVLSRPG